MGVDPDLEKVEERLNRAGMSVKSTPDFVLDFMIDSAENEKVRAALQRERDGRAS